MSEYRVLRFPLKIVDHQKLHVPGLEVVLSVAASRDDPTGVDMWAMCRDGGPVKMLDVWIVGTGNPMPDPADVVNFIGTAVTRSTLVWHVFASVGDS